MHEKFVSLEPEKQERILNAAMKEFAQKGYKNASTNEIVAEAGISKGLLFHYFHNKKDLYLYLYDYIMEVIVKEFFEKIDLQQRDILARLRQCARLKMEIIHKHPEMFQFALSANLEDAEEIKSKLQPRNKEILAKSYAALLEKVDTTVFKEGIDTERAVRIIFWTIEGYSNQEQQRVKSLELTEEYYERATAELDLYLEMLRKSFYR
ncbi:TetR/AcrR family transcriptional regulator [Paenibacillus sp. H1-7]|uniref:TetR/AcrR family transcriptional regulator n=1 Tax=Paenibacillus sp. H1-7 TaxID=2282849 RepID=UPI001EF77A59|nr:TetR/AcrR family transcriptional regulator [Paenibacillus sp. H1-7]ULL13079.1 TetR/AcrR family transcriptional regulator [Paenibacillus sp. H1-7]